MKVSISTLGCKSNQYDSSALEDSLRDASLDVVPFPGPADAYIINTCTVTGRTDSQSRQLIRKVRKLNPKALVVVTGCYAQVSPDEAASIEGVDFVIGNPEKGKIAEYLLKGRQSAIVKDVGPSGPGTPWSLRARTSSGRTRANLKVQEGCSRACSYCIIPSARGSSKSLPLAEVEKEIALLIGRGYREVILTGIHLGGYSESGGDLTSILELIERRDYPARFRISSLDPDEVTDGLIDILKTAKRVCNHLHLTLQSGDDTIIRRMRRPYTAKTFREKVLRLFEAVPEISIGVDVIAGFPGEGEREFLNTYDLLSDLPISYLHIFPFSVRKDTPAASFTGKVNPAGIKERCARLKELDGEKRRAFLSAFIDREAEALMESARDKKTNLLKGRTRNYIQVNIKGGDELRNSLSTVILTGLMDDGMTADFIKAVQI